MRNIQKASPKRGAIPSGSGAIIAEIAARGPLSRHAILKTSGLARATVLHRLERLFAANLIRETERVVPRRGRPTALIDIDKQCSVILAADVGEKFIRLSVTDLEPAILCEEVIEYDSRAEPYGTLEEMGRAFEAMTDRLDPRQRKVLGACIGLPAPVDFEEGMATGPSVISGWERLPIRDWMANRLGVPTYVENDVNLLTIAEKRRAGREAGHFFFVKAGTGIGSGIVSHGVLYRGHRGASGDIGHIQFSSPPLHRCRCGKLGCVESRASGWAIARDLRAAGIEAFDSSDVLRLVQAGNPQAIALVRQAGPALGEVIADAVSILNPDRIAIGGTLAGAGELLLEGLREAVLRRALPIATEELSIVAVDHSPSLGLIGAACLVRELEFSPARADATVRRLGAPRAVRDKRDQPAMR